MLLQRLQRALSCVTAAVLARSPAAPSGTRGLLLNRGQPAALPGSPSLWLDVELRYETRQVGTGRAWDAEVGGYIYSVQTADRAELLAYHWHPTTISRVTVPHLHVGGVIHDVISHRTHLPTGHVLLEDVVRLVIEEFRVPPRRADWPNVLDVAR